jgi:cyclase
LLWQRLIPVLLLSNGRFVKTVNFNNPKYLGDPINIIRTFNDLLVDEIIILDIEASKNRNPPDFNFIKKLADECCMPLCYGGGVSNVESIERLIELGVEKVSINSATFLYPSLISEAVSRVGSQSVVAAVDVALNASTNRYEVAVPGAFEPSIKDLVAHSQSLANAGAGEILINNITLDGTLMGYDYTVLDSLFGKISIPITIVGGANGWDDIERMTKHYPGVGIGIGSHFVLKGRYRAVLISYPTWEERMTHS